MGERDERCWDEKLKQYPHDCSAWSKAMLVMAVIFSITALVLLVLEFSASYSIGFAALALLALFSSVGSRAIGKHVSRLTKEG